jgi:GGDEF domain-containing protein
MPTPDSAGGGSPDALQTALNGYLSTLAAIADCVGEACPEIGSPYRQRLHRLRTRLAFQLTPESMEDSVVSVAGELDEYAERASGYINLHAKQFARAIAALEETVHAMAERQEFYGSRLRQFAAQMERTRYPTEPEHIAEVIALQVSGLLSVVDSMSHEAESLVARLQAQIEAAEHRLADAQIADPVTGLLNRREMERQIAARRHEADPVLLRFVISARDGGEPPSPVMRVAAEKLTGHFRHRDLIARWRPGEFLVLFDGRQEIAQKRATQAVPWLAGSYSSPEGAVEVSVEAGLVQIDELLPREGQPRAEVVSSQS